MKVSRTVALVLAVAAASACGSSKKKTGADAAEAGTTSAAAQGGGSGTGGSSGRSATGGTSASGRGGARGASGGGSGAGGASGDAGGEGGASSAAGGMSAGGSAGMAPKPTVEGCATWELQTAQGATSTITLSDGGLVLLRPGDATNTATVFNTTDVVVSQAGLSGDFDVVLDFSEFRPGDAIQFVGPEFQMGVYKREASGSIYQAVGRVGAGDAILGIVIPDEDPQISFFDPVPATLDDASGSIELARKSGIVTVTITINGVENSISSTTPYDADDLTLFIGIGLYGSSQGPADASVLVSKVEVEGGGGTVKSDPFTCAP
jgi:hypothetical protein